MKFPSGKERECGQKFRHPDYLSALCHAKQLSEKESQESRERLVIYPCSYCEFLHLGHLPKSKQKMQQPSTVVPVLPVHEPPSKEVKPKRVHDLAWHLARSKRRIARAEAAIASFTNPRPRTVRRHAQGLRDMRRHLASLEAQARSAESSNPDSGTDPGADLSQFPVEISA